jgi:hypothetical protein
MEIVNLTMPSKGDADITLSQRQSLTGSRALVCLKEIS